MDRDVRISFQPRQGYGVSVSENAIWASPNSYEILPKLVAINRIGFTQKSAA